MFLHILPFTAKLLNTWFVLKAEFEMGGSKHPAETASLFLDPPTSDRKGNKSSVNGSHE